MQCESCQHENAEGLRSCEKCGRGLRATYGELRQLTVLFADLANSSALSEQLDAEDYQGLIHAYQSASVNAVTRFSGHVAQYLGDGVLVYFGYPEAYEDAARFAVEAGLELVQRVAALNGQRWLRHSISARVGIATGMIVAASTASGSGAQTLAFGQTPNIAARLQGEARRALWYCQRTPIAWWTASSSSSPSASGRSRGWLSLWSFTAQSGRSPFGTASI